jgi:chemotaxis protein MotB
MKIKLFYLPSLLCIVMAMSSCVAQKEFDALASEKTALENEKATLEEQLDVANEKLNRLEVQVANLTKDKQALQSDFDIVDKELKEVKSEYNRIKQLYDNLLSNSGQLNRDLGRQQQRLLAIEDDLEVERKKNEELAADLTKREARVAELERLIAEKDQAVQQLKKKVTDALLNFNEGDLSVEVKNGKVYVSLAEKLLFGSGSTKVDAKGVTALKQLAGVLSGNSDLNIVVEGHTDNVPISRKSQYMNDNWDLSVMRATSIVKILVDNGVNPKIVTASGKSEFVPVAENDTAENKALNRRTEIILTPKLDELFQILESY